MNTAIAVKLWEMEHLEKGEWVKEGFWSVGGFTAYRFADKRDADATLAKLHPNKRRRTVLAKSVMQEDNHSCH